ncbi:hypothetical protein OH76DRAFT_1398063 [Lentinus brumalis]|uniref:Uncharacterized protein n=1 Tax=Lentinus brumalis TaxID=2498619 RepID=A0A371DQ60_9APHY|nr:hypothetical protein OH76DRAFT_1398063 [Polyporus brumalis]
MPAAKLQTWITTHVRRPWPEHGNKGFYGTSSPLTRFQIPPPPSSYAYEGMTTLLSPDPRSALPGMG